MKKLLYASLLGFMAVCVTACQSENKDEELLTVGFEQAQLGTTGYAESTSYSESGIVFSNNYNADWGSWSGFAVSNCTDTETPGYLNMYSVAAGKAASGKQFAVAFYFESDGPKSCNLKFSDGKDHVIRSVSIANSTYGYLSMLQGSAFSKKFSDGDFLVMIFTGIDAKGNTIGTMKHYLADFTNGNHKLSTDWETVDFSSLGAVNEVDITFDCSDKGDFGINTPTYACIDNIIYVK